MRVLLLCCAIAALGVSAVACGDSEGAPTADDSASPAAAPAASGDATPAAPTADDSAALATATPTAGASGAAPSATQPPANDAAAAATPGLDPARFLDGALAEAPATEPCTLSGGATAECWRITVVGLPVDHEAGPFCPPTTSSTAEEGGVWLDGEGLYDIDGAFIEGLAELYGDDNWRLYEDDGSVRITDTPEAFDGAARPNVAEEHQNHCVEGRLEWLPDGEPVASTVIIPASPVTAASPAANAAPLGVTLNGARIDGSAPVADILRAYTIAAFDDCGGHFNPAVGYHVHASMGCSGVEVEGHGLHIGYAVDGYAIHTEAEAAHEAAGAFDACGGHESEGVGYHYHAAPAAENNVLRCLSGQYMRTGRAR